MQCYKLTAVAPDSVLPRLDVVEHRLGAFWAQQQQARILCNVRPASFAARLAQLDAPQDWRRPYLLEQRAWYKQLESTTYEVDSYLALWDADRNAATVQQSLPDSLSVPSVESVPFPELVHGRYTEHATYLAPAGAGAPHLAVLTAYDVAGDWAPVGVGIAENWNRLLMLDLPITLAIDVRTVDAVQAAGWLDWISGWKLTQDATQSLTALQGGMHTGALHLVRYAILLRARRPGAFADMEEQIKRVLGRRLLVDRVHGAQAEHVMFFQNVAPKAINTPAPARNTTSHGVGCKTPIAIERYTDQAGVLLGRDMDQRTPLHYKLFGDDNRRNGNAIVLGTSGSGKTTFMLASALRLALQGAQVVMLEPANRARLLRDAIGDDRACVLHDVADMPAINVLDVVSLKALDQRESVQRRLEIALGKARGGAGGRLRVDPHELTHEEIAALDTAIQHEQVYGVGCHKLPSITPATAPLLRDLVHALGEQGTPEATALARRIRSVLLGVAADTFDSHTSLHFDSAADVSLYSFQGVSQHRLPLVYDALFSMLNRYVWSPQRNKDRPLVLFLDEYFYMASVESLAQHVVRSTKTWRNQHAGLWACDQNAEVFFSTHGEHAGGLITDNCRQRFIFQSMGGADIVQAAYPDRISADRGMQLRGLDRGQYLAVLEQSTRLVQVELTPLEQAHLL